MTANLYAIAYDIRNDSRRTRVANVLKSFGERVQFSVFECHLHRDEAVELKAEINDRIDQAEDSVRIYRIDADVVCLGATEPRALMDHLIL